MLTQKTFNMTTTFDGEVYRTKVSQSEYIDSGKENELPVNSSTEKEYSGVSLEAVQDQISDDFKVKFVKFENLFDWFWF